MRRDDDGTARPEAGQQVRVWQSPGSGSGEAPTRVRWEQIDRLREESLALLARVAAQAGEESPLYRGCAALWRRTESEAWLSLLHSDFGNALRRLEQAHHALSQAPQAARRGELQASEIEALLSCV